MRITWKIEKLSLDSFAPGMAIYFWRLQLSVVSGAAKPHSDRLSQSSETTLAGLSVKTKSLQPFDCFWRTCQTLFTFSIIYMSKNSHLSLGKLWKQARWPRFPDSRLPHEDPDVSEILLIAPGEVGRTFEPRPSWQLPCHQSFGKHLRHLWVARHAKRLERMIWSWYGWTVFEGASLWVKEQTCDFEWSRSCDGHHDVWLCAPTGGAVHTLVQCLPFVPLRIRYMTRYIML